ncbi:MAG: HAD hydrolase-like protein [Gammaproteobacteria bacterium]|nr:HAD hydrolase-like protein [Gammaproteobacteria bacterium]
MHIIFDFDGTLADSFECMIKQFAKLSVELSLGAFQETQGVQLKDFSSRELIKHFNIPLYKIPTIIKRIRAHMQHEILSIPPFMGMPEAIKKLSASGFSLGILTSNSRDNVTRWLAHNQLDTLFQFVRVESSFFSKKKGLKNILKRYNTRPVDAIYIGDETRDIEAALANEMRVLAVTWGYASESVLAQCGPTRIIRNPSEILQYLNVVAGEAVTS